MRDRPTRLFLRFRDRGDGAAFAQLFDLVAPELLAVAVRLAPDVATAEDLVQTTFVAAIERARTFEAARDVKPWLFGILTREAVLARRRAARRPDPERVRHDDVEPGPFETVSAAETQALVERALDDLGDPYRSVLRPYLFEGLGAAEIARRAGPRRMSPGHVRVAIGRGLEQLVRSLPRGVALGGAVDATSARGLDAIRDLVLSDIAARPRAALAATSPAAVVASVLAAAAAAAVSLTLWTIANEGRRTGPSDPTAEAVSLSATGAGLHRTVLVAVEIEGRSVPDTVDEGVQDAARAPLVLQARSRVVDDAGVPVEGAVIASLDGHGYPDTTRSATDGTFPWQSRMLRSCFVVWHERFAATIGEWRGEPLEVKLVEPAALLEVDVVDEREVAVSRAAVRLSHEEGANTHENWPSVVFNGLITDDGGRARLAGLHAGKFELRVTAPGYVEERVQLELETGARRRLSVTVREGRRVTGTILDLRGVPVEGAVAGVRGSRTVTSVQPDGTYVLDGVPLTEVELFAEHDEKREARLRIDAGSNRAWNVVLEDLYVLRGTIVDDGGQPLEGWLFCLLEGGDSPADYRARDMELITRFAMTQSDGSFELGKVPASDFALSVRGPGFGSEDGPALVLTDLVAPMPSLLLRVPHAPR